MWIGKSYSNISADVAPEPGYDYVDSLTVYRISENF